MGTTKGTASSGIGSEWTAAKRQVGKAISTTLDEVKSEGAALASWLKTGEGSKAAKAAGRSILKSFQKHRAATGAVPQS
jgi:hypothetical protein